MLSGCLLAGSSNQQRTGNYESSTAVFLLFGGSDKKETNGTAFVELKDGVVTNKWRG